MFWIVSDFAYGSYVFQAYGSCPLANGTVANAAGTTTTEQAVSAQFVQTAVDVLRIVDGYEAGRTDAAVECGRNASDECAGEAATATTTGNWSGAAVGYGAESIGRVLDKLMLLDGGEYNVTLVHVTEYGGEAAGAYVQDSYGARRLLLLVPPDAGRLYLDACGDEEACPTCRLPPAANEPRDDQLVPIVWLTWKQDVWMASALTVSAVGAACAATVASFILIRVCKKDVMEGNPTFTFLLVVGTILTYASAVPFAVDSAALPQVLCYARLFGPGVGCCIVFSTMLARAAMIAACDCDSSFMSHVNGYLQTWLCAFAASVQLALMLEFTAVHAVVPSSDLCRVFVRGRLFLGSLSYDALLLVLLCVTTPCVFRSKRNYREGACFAIAAYATLAIWLGWFAAHVALPDRWADLSAVVGLTGTATAVVVAVLVPRTYMMTYGIVRERIAGSLPSLGYGHGACSVTDVNYRSTQALYDSVRVTAAPPKCPHSTSTFKGQSNPNYYSPAGSQVHSVPGPRSRPLTPVNEYDVPPSPNDRMTRF